MGKTKIEWADFVFNPWVGCTKVSPACDHCYAEAWAKRAGDPQLWQGARRRTTVEYWQQPFRWNDAAAKACKRARVFCASLADVFDNVVDEQWRADLFRLIRGTPNLDWLLLTKRIGNAARMLQYAMLDATNAAVDWDDQPLGNVWLGATVVNQEEADRDVPKLLAIPARVRFLSIEPMLGPIDLAKAGAIWSDMNYVPVTRPFGQQRLNWVIAGGESGGHARPAHPSWFANLRDQCAEAEVPFLFKQWGDWAPNCLCGGERSCRQTPRPAQGLPGVMFRCGKTGAGRELFGRTHDEFPMAAACS